MKTIIILRYQEVGIIMIIVYDIYYLIVISRVKIFYLINILFYKWIFYNGLNKNDIIGIIYMTRGGTRNFGAWGKVKSIKLRKKKS